MTYKIGEAAALLNLKTYVLRFWETEFPQVAPLRTEKGQRLYTEEHVAALKRIRHLLHERGLTIEGARKILAEEARGGKPVSAFPLLDALDDESSAPDYATPAKSFPLAAEAGAGISPELLEQAIMELKVLRNLLAGEKS